MDVIFIAATLGLWLAMVLMAWGLTRLEKTGSTRP
jgi:hypothetical protein